MYAGIATRAAALAVDALAALSIFAVGSAVVALIASLVGGIRPQWLAGSLLGLAWIIVGGGYFVLFWSAAGQTPGMRLMRLRVQRPGGGGLSVGRAFRPFSTSGAARSPTTSPGRWCCTTTRRRRSDSSQAGDDRHPSRLDDSRQMTGRQ
jgi:uncharacterized RDD family membrane protein YckC